MSSSLISLIELAKEPSSEKRRELLREVTSIFMTHPEEIAETEMALYDSVMSQLSSDMESIVRAEIANTIASARVAPRYTFLAWHGPVAFSLAARPARARWAWPPPVPPSRRRRSSGALH